MAETQGRKPATAAQRRKASSATDEGRPTKRARVAVACQRCKTRKQKCDGVQPVCGNCSGAKAECIMILPSRPMPFGKNQYIKSLEDRVAELESILAQQGVTEIGGDHWRRASSSTSPIDDQTSSLHRQSISIDAPRDFNSGEIPCDQHGAPSIVPDFKSLALYAGGGFIGEASDIKVLGTMIRSVARSKEILSYSPGSSDGTNLQSLAAPRGSFENDSPIPDVTLEGTDLASLPDFLADKMFRGYLKYISTRWPLLHTSQLHEMHANRKSTNSPYDTSILHLVYAIGGRYLETTGQTGNFLAERHYSAALVHLDELLSKNDLHSLQILLLLAIYSLRAPHRPGAWDLIRSATGICIGLGYHRKANKVIGLLENEMRKRVFWTCYSLDRQVSITLGRPFAISDLDIDVELPYDVDEHIEDAVMLTEAIQATLDPNALHPRATTQSSFVHMVRLRRIESYIQQRLYRVDQSKPISEEEVDHIMNRLFEWKNNIPARNTTLVESETAAADGTDYYMTYYYKCLRFLLYPLLFQAPVNPRFLKECAKACAGVCHTYKRLIRTKPVGFSLMALHQLFLAGLTLLYCVWAAPEEFRSFSISKDINACSVLLYIIAERWPGAAKYRDAFEEITQNVLELIETSQQPRMPIDKLSTGLQTDFHIADMNTDDRNELSRMIATMAGHPDQIEENSAINEFVNNAAQIPQMVKFFAHDSFVENLVDPAIESDSSPKGGQYYTTFEDTQFPPDNLDLLSGIEFGDFMANQTGMIST